MSHARPRLPVVTLDALGREDFVALLGGVFEHSPWVAARAWEERPFGSVEALHAAMARLVREAGEGPQMALLAAHPELALQGRLTSDSEAEQRSVGLDALEAAEADMFAEKNRLYRERFGFPFIIAVRGQKDRAAILAALDRRLSGAVGEERGAAIEEVIRIARFRLDDRLTDTPAGRLTVHVLDTTAGRPAAGLSLSLARLEGTTPVPLGVWTTNADGRCDAPLLQGEALRAGEYEIVFEVAAWRSGGGFYDRIPIRFRIDDPAAHVHVPLLLAPFGYSTYRGS